MKLTAKAASLDIRPGDDRNDGGHDWICTPCGSHVPGRWGHCSTCHLTFASLRDFDKHRTGKYENRAIGQPNTRRCLTTDELLAAGWTQYDRNLWRSPPPTPTDALPATPP